MNERIKDKLMTTAEAFSNFVRNGDHPAIGNYTVATCASLYSR